MACPHRRLVAIAALAVAAAAAAIVGLSQQAGQPRMSLIPAGPPIAELSVVATSYECCDIPGAYIYRVDLQGPGGPWEGEVASAEIGSTAPVIPRLPEMLSEGVFSLRTEIWVSGDAIYPGETGPRISGPVATCATTLAVAPATRRATVTLAYWSDACAAGAILFADPTEVTALNVVPSMQGRCGLDGAEAGGCEYRLALAGPGGTWASAIQSVRPADQLVLGGMPAAISPGAYRLEATSLRMSLEPEPGVGTNTSSASEQPAPSTSSSSQGATRCTSPRPSSARPARSASLSRTTLVPKAPGAPSAPTASATRSPSRLSPYVDSGR